MTRMITLPVYWLAGRNEIDAVERKLACFLTYDEAAAHLGKKKDARVLSRIIRETITTVGFGVCRGGVGFAYRAEKYLVPLDISTDCSVCRNQGRTCGQCIENWCASENIDVPTAYVLLPIVDNGLKRGEVMELTKCECGAITVTLSGKTYSMQPETYRKLFGVSRVPKSKYYKRVCCDHCVNHWGVDLCACGSGESPSACKEGHSECGNPMQDIREAGVFCNGKICNIVE